MTSAVATWDRKDRSWSVDCPNCGKTNEFDLAKPDVPDGFDEEKDKLCADIECWSCRDELKVFVMVKSRTRKPR